MLIQKKPKRIRAGRQRAENTDPDQVNNQVNRHDQWFLLPTELLISIQSSALSLGVLHHTLRGTSAQVRCFSRSRSFAGDLLKVQREFSLGQEEPSGWEAGL